MDYKYIEQLLERYWNSETSVEEEHILRAFFRQKELPAHLLHYKALFAFMDKESEIGLGEDFDARILAQIDRPVVKAQCLTLRGRLMPLLKAAAMLLLVLTLSGVMQYSMAGSETDVVYVYDEFERCSVDPQVAYEADTIKASLKSVPVEADRGHEAKK